jgi:hypothetical protein
MDNINLSGKNYPIRFDFRALKEYKSISNNDALTGFVNNTDNIVTLTYCALKSGQLFNDKKVEFTMTEEDVSSILGVGDTMKVVNAFLEEVGVKGDQDKADKSEPEKPGEVSGTV